VTAVRPGREALLLVVACALLYLSGAGEIPFYTRGEPREGLVVREMVRGGPWLVPSRPGGEPTRKPPLYYWAAAVAWRALPDAPELALRLPSAAAATAAVLAVWATARVVLGAAAGLPAALVLATTFEWTRAATSARVDMVLAATLTAVLCAWALALAGRTRAWLAAGVGGAALATLAKGPVALVLPLLAALGLRASGQRIRALRPALVLALAAALAGAWYAAAVLHGGRAFVDVVARENLLRFVDAEDAGVGHAHGAGYLVALGLVGLLPWTPLLPLFAAPLTERPRRAAVGLAGAWVATGFVFFALAAGKRSVYLLPLHPAIALLAGAAVATPPAAGRLRRIARIGGALYAPAGVALAAAALALAAGLDAPPALRTLLRPADAVAASALADAARDARDWLAAAAVLTLLAVPFVVRATRGAEWRRLIVLVAMLFVAWTATFARLHPAIARTRSLRDFMATVGRTVPEDARLYAFFPPDPGLRFYAPRDLQPWPTDGRVAGGYLLLWEDEWQRLRDPGGRPLEVLSVSAARVPRRGHLALVTAPQGPLRTVGAPSRPPELPGLRTGNRPR